ncbi:MAG: hypothetical protein NTV54_03040 [Ignavibacteriales bacterium]|nr:hypothetical protein [Ignavibacteriales bacterium]
MADESGNTKATLQWKWVLIGVIVGVVFMTVSFLSVVSTFHNTPIQLLVTTAGFILIGAIVGYLSPGVTIREAMIAGIITMLVMAGIIVAIDAEVGHDKVMMAVLLLFSGIFSLVGGWIGENLQGTLKGNENPASFQYKWVIVGTVVGFVLNVLFVFLLPKLYNMDLQIMSFIFAFSFVVTGFVVGLKSPGVTLKEPAVAGAIAIVIEYLFIQLSLGVEVPMTYLLIGLAEGFLLTFFGAWAGEYVQSMTERVTEKAE